MSSDQYLNSDVLEPLINHYARICQFNSSLLKHELAKAKIALLEGIHVNVSAYPNIAKLYDLMYTIPVSTASVERSFSAFGRIMTLARNKLSSERASDFVIIAMNKDLMANIKLENGSPPAKNEYCICNQKEQNGVAGGLPCKNN